MTELEIEVAELAARFGEPRRMEASVRPFFDPIQRPDRFGEVCMVIRRRDGKIPLSIKTFYPRGAYRLPTGGIHQGERILDALRRETDEETALEVDVRRFLAWITYRDVSIPTGPPLFHTFAFLLDEIGGTFKTRDQEEQIEDWIEVAPSALSDVADRLDRIASAPSKDIGGDWADWGRFRAIVHRAVAEELSA
ncbi:MAG TPA: NUDIX hydrolase [Verrucomicrobiae bacterium]|nr:NUDIX hydrolase [Verrucomicrobiae bacterium]